MLFTSPVSGSNVIAYRCVYIPTQITGYTVGHVGVSVQTFNTKMGP